jgi:hypothetical protein
VQRACAAGCAVVAAYKVGGAGQLGGDDACAMPVLARVAAGRHPSRDCRRWPETDLEGWTLESKPSVW